MKEFFKRQKTRAAESVKAAGKKSSDRYHQLEAWVAAQYRAFTAWHGSLELRKQNRVTLLIISLVLLGNYLMICFHTGRNPATSFIPSLPVLDFRDEVTVFLPSSDGSLLTEQRLVERPDSDERFISKLTSFVIEGSAFENTRVMTPVQGNVRKVWLYNGECFIDMRLETLDHEAPVIPGSEKAFREALSKTVISNLKGIKKVTVLENGIPDKNIWDIKI